MRTARGKLRLIFLSTAILCATVLQRLLTCSLKFRWLSNVTPSSFCEVTYSISLPLHAIFRALFEIFFSKRLPVTSRVFVLEVFSTILFSDVQSAILFMSSCSRCCTTGTVIRGAYTGAVQAYLTISLVLEVERPTSKAREKRRGTRLDIFYQTAHFFWLKMCLSLSPAQTLLRKAKLARGCQNCRKFCFKHQRCSQFSQVF